MTEQGHVTAVKAGENQGVTLQHDYVVRDYRTVPAWSASTGAPQTLAFQLQAPADADGAAARGQPGRGRCRQRPAGAGR